MKKFITVLTVLSLFMASPALAWRRGYGYNGYNGYNNNWGAAAGIGLGLGILGGAIAADQYYRNQQYYRNPYYNNPYYGNPYYGNPYNPGW